jgi:hypothetical protein
LQVAAITYARGRAVPLYLQGTSLGTRLKRSRESFFQQREIFLTQPLMSSPFERNIFFKFSLCTPFDHSIELRQKWFWCKHALLFQTRNLAISSRLIDASYFLALSPLFIFARCSCKHSMQELNSAHQISVVNKSAYFARSLLPWDNTSKKHF